MQNKNEELEPVETEFGDDELAAMLGVVAEMTKGVYTTPSVKPGQAPHYIKVEIDYENQVSHRHEGQEQKGWMCIAALLDWGPDILDEHMTMDDYSLKTKTKQRLANAATIAWVGNNLHRLIYEVIEMRRMLVKYGLLEARKQ